MQNNNKSFREQYAQLKIRHPSLSEIDDPVLTEIENEIPIDINTQIFMMAILSAIFLLASYPFFSFEIYKICLNWQSQLANTLNLETFFQNHRAIFISIIIIFFVVPLYTILLKKFESLRSRFFPIYLKTKLHSIIMQNKTIASINKWYTKREERFANINTKNLQYICFAVALNYFNISIFLFFATAMI